MKIKYIVALMTVIATAGGCTQDTGEQPEEAVPIRFAATIAPTDIGKTRAAGDWGERTTTQGTEFLNGEHVFVYIKENDGTHQSDIKWPIEYQVANDGDGDADDGDLNPVSDTTPFFFPVGVNTINIHAIHPSYTSGTGFTVLTDQTTEANYVASDLCYSKPTDYTRTGSGTDIDTNGRRILQFKHLLSKIVVNLTVDANSGATGAPSYISLHAKTSTAMEFPADNANGYTYCTPSDATTPGVIKMKQEAIIPPQTIAAGASFLSMTVPGIGPMIYPLPASTTFTSGKRYTYNIKVNNVGITATTDIDNWGTTVNGEVVGEAFIRPTLPIEYVAEYNMGAPSAEPMTMASDHLKTSTYFYDQATCNSYFNQTSSLNYTNKHVTISGKSGTYHLPSIQEARTLIPEHILYFSPASETIVQTGKGEQLQWGQYKDNNTYAVPLQTFYNEFASSPAYCSTNEKVCYAIRLKASDIAGPQGYGPYTCAYRYMFVNNDADHGNNQTLHIKVRYLGPYSSVVLSDITNSSFWNESGVEYFERIFPAFGYTSAAGYTQEDEVQYRTATWRNNDGSINNYYCLSATITSLATTGFTNTQYRHPIRLFKDAE